MQFLKLIQDPTTKISFNLTGLPGGAWAAVGRAAGRGLSGQATEWELLMIKNSAEALSRTTFYLNGREILNPFR